jgi:hypothetical protein
MKGFQKSYIEKILCYPFKLKYLNQKVFYPTLKKRGFFSWKYSVYIWKGFQSFKLKYLNQKVFYLILKKHDFFSWEHRVYILMGFKSHIWKKKTGSRPGHPGSGLTRRVARVWPGCCHSQSFIKPGPVQSPGRSGPGLTHRAGPGLITVPHPR